MATSRDLRRDRIVLRAEAIRFRVAARRVGSVGAIRWRSGAAVEFRARVAERARGIRACATALDDAAAAMGRLERAIDDLCEEAS